MRTRANLSPVAAGLACPGKLCVCQEAGARAVEGAAPLPGRDCHSLAAGGAAAGARAPGECRHRGVLESELRHLLEGAGHVEASEHDRQQCSRSHCRHRAGGVFKASNLSLEARREEPRPSRPRRRRGRVYPYYIM